MKSLIVALLMLAGSAQAADTYTPRIGLTKPAINSYSWGTKTNTNWDIVDSSVCVSSAGSSAIFGFVWASTISAYSVDGITAYNITITSPVWLSPGWLAVGSTFSVRDGTTSIRGGLSVVGPVSITTGSVAGDWSVGGGTTLVTLGGKVGVGTASPFRALSLGGTAGNQDLMFCDTTSGCLATDGYQIQYRTSSTELFHYLAEDYEMSFWTAGVERFRLGPSAAPGATFAGQVSVSSLTARGAIESRDGASTLIGAASAAYGAYLDSSNALRLNPNNNGTTTIGGDKVTVLTGGSVGIGTPAPTGKLHLSSGAVIVDGDGAVLRTTGTFVTSGNSIAILDDGAGTAATYTLTPESSFYRISCADANGCNVTIAETGMLDGTRLTIMAAAMSGALNILGLANQVNLAGGIDWTPDSTGDTLSLIYDGVTTPEWVETGRSNN